MVKYLSVGKGKGYALFLAKSFWEMVKYLSVHKVRDRLFFFQGGGGEWGGVVGGAAGHLLLLRWSNTFWLARVRVRLISFLGGGGVEHLLLLGDEQMPFGWQK